MSPSVSAIITTYNYARYLEAAIESVLSQTVPPDEVVVVDDGSTDDTAKVVEPFLARGVRYVTQSHAGDGGATTRNRGLLETTCDLVAFLDADDRWLPNKLARQLEHLRLHPSCGLITGDEWQVSESDEMRRLVKRRPAERAYLYPRILVENSIGNSSMVLVRRECFREVGVFDESLRLGQDWDMWIRIARRFPVGILGGDPLIYFTKHPGSITAGQTDARYASNQLIFSRYINQVRSPIRRRLLRRTTRSMSDFYAAAAFVNQPGRQRAALQMALRSFYLDPTYKTPLKLALIVHAALGPTAFAHLSKSVRKFSNIG